MTELEALIQDEIAARGPIPFDRYMDLALYHPRLGYYRRTRDPFGKEGDFYTAEQLQPVFGILIAARIRSLLAGMEDAAVVELGAGRREMADAFASLKYVPVDVSDAFPSRIRGCVFSNEFFDALPVEAVVCRQGVLRRRHVAWSGERFVWSDGDRVDDWTGDYLSRYTVPREEGGTMEVHRCGLEWMERIAQSLESGAYVVTIDYGYTARESVRFPEGTLMSYRRHQAHEDVLIDPGGRDITAHVPFTALEQHGRRFGLQTVSLESLALTLMDAGEPDAFKAALDGPSEAECAHRRMQLKTLLFGMGETFRTLIQRKE